MDLIKEVNKNVKLKIGDKVRITKINEDNEECFSTMKLKVGDEIEVLKFDGVKVCHPYLRDYCDKVDTDRCILFKSCSNESRVIWSCYCEVKKIK